MQANLSTLVQRFLKNHKLYIADIGATGGPELRWKNWQKLCHFYTFDPDPRAQAWSENAQNFPIGLWSKKCTKTLTLAAYPPATSLFKMNQDQVSAFLHHSSLKAVGEEKIELDTLDAILCAQRVDFLKIDAEGAELEILKGAKTILQSHCLGVQVEVCFCPIRQKVPLFGELDRFITSSGFQLFQLEREHWFRKNAIAGFSSDPQLIWGNALYLLPKQLFLKKLEQSEEAEMLLLKYLLILFAYHLYDYAYELCEEVSFESTAHIKECLKKVLVSKSTYVISLICSLLVGSSKYLCSLSKKQKQHKLCYLKRKIRELGRACLYLGKNDYALYD